MRFSFRLQSLLNWKRKLEESSQTRLAKKIKKLKKQEEEIQELVQKRIGNDKELNKKMMRGVQIGEYLIHKQFEEDSYDGLLAREGLRKRTEGEIEGEREHLIGLMRERKMLEKIKERRLRKFLYQMEKLEQKKIDEIAIRQYPSGFKENPL